jgi:adenylosuccinate synthase
MIEYADVIVDLQAGDTGKGKVCNSLSQIKDEYTHVIRYNGGGNAGHTIYQNGKKIVTHFIPSGIINGLKSIIGPGCVVDINKFFKEIEELKSLGIDTDGKIFIDKRVNIITEEHLIEDSKDVEIGTTKTGNGPCYRDKYFRKGRRANEFDELKNYIIDIYSELHGDKSCKILFEGAQGFELDIDWGDYPYVTSSHCTIGSAILNGVPPQNIRKVYGVSKAYNTYVGAKKYENQSEIFNRIREIGNEYGATTGRPRQIGWTDIDKLIKACNINGVTHLVVNKVDILQRIGEFSIIVNNLPYTINDVNFLKQYFNSVIKENCPLVQEIIFSYSQDSI